MNEEQRLSDVLDDTLSYIDRYVWFQSDHQLYAVTLWIALTYIVDYVDTAAKLWLTSPTRECGKTLVLDIVQQVAWEPRASVNISNAALFRLAAGGATLLFDEVDNIFGRNGDEDQRAIINASSRRGQKAIRMAGPPQNLRVEEHDVFCVMALAGIGKVPDTVASRCIPIRMQRKPRSIKKQRWRLRVERKELEQLRLDIEAAIAPLAQEIGKAWPSLPDELGDRQQDIWEPLIAIADAAGNDWESWARAAAVALHSGVDESDGSVGIQLLADTREAFGDDDRLATKTLLERLCDMEEAPWGDWFGKPITARFLASKLKPFNVHSKTIRFGHSTPKGYERTTFLDAWDRYLPATFATDATTQPADRDPADSQPATPRQQSTTPNNVAEQLTEVADQESAERPSPTTDVVAVADVAP